MRVAACKECARQRFKNSCDSVSKDARESARLRLYACENVFERGVRNSKRKREREKERKRERGKKKEKENERKRMRERETERKREREKERKRERDK